MLDRIYTEFKNIFIHFCDTTSVHGLKYLTCKTIGKLERWVWAIIIITFTALMIYLCSNLYNAFYENLTVTTLDDTHYPISKLPLPAVGICSNNKLSKKRVTEFIERVSAKFNRTEEWLFQQILWLGKLYEYNVHGVDNRIELQSIIDEIIADKDTFGDIPSFMSLMDMLSVPCEQLLHECFWLGKQIDCDRIFERRITMDGFCCMFNYARPRLYKKNSSEVVNSRLIDLNSKEDRTSFNVQQGLKILILHNAEDYLYTDLMLEGVIVKVFPNDIFPDSAGGEVADVFCGMREELYLNIETSRIQSEDQLKYYSKAVRGCVLKNEPSIIYGTTALSDCLVDCKIKAVLALCKCIPFTLNFDGMHTVCTILDLSCLNKYKEKLSTIYPSTIKTNELEHEKQDSILCDCYPACTRTNYKVYVNKATLNHIFGHKTGHSLIHLFYGNNVIDLYRTDVVSYWFELLGNIGGLCGVILGASVISVFEILYFLLLYVCRVTLICTKKDKGTTQL